MSTKFDIPIRRWTRWAPVIGLAIVVLTMSLGCRAPAQIVTEAADLGPTAPVQQSASASEAPPLFTFRSSFWLNLHLRIYHEAILDRPPPPGAPPPPDDPAWTAAVRYYEASFRDSGPMGLFLDEDVVELNRKLGAATPHEIPAGVEPQLAAHLAEVAALVRDEWPEQDRANREWIAALEQKLERHGPEMRAELVHMFGVEWPNPPPLVDVSCFAGPFGAFTVLDPVQTTISSCVPAYGGDASLEMIFHEPTHALVGPIQEELDRLAAQKRVQLPPDLWHALVFYTVGEVARRQLGPEYVEYATKNQLWDRGWQQAREALKTAWQPYVDGDTPLDEALEDLVAEVGVPE